MRYVFCSRGLVPSKQTERDYKTKNELEAICYRVNLPDAIGQNTVRLNLISSELNQEPVSDYRRSGAILCMDHTLSNVEIAHVSSDATFILGNALKASEQFAILSGHRGLMKFFFRDLNGTPITKPLAWTIVVEISVVDTPDAAHAVYEAAVIPHTNYVVLSDLLQTSTPSVVTPGKVNALMRMWSMPVPKHVSKDMTVSIRSFSGYHLHDTTEAPIGPSATASLVLWCVTGGQHTVHHPGGISASAITGSAVDTSTVSDASCSEAFAVKKANKIEIGFRTPDGSPIVRERWFAILRIANVGEAQDHVGKESANVSATKSESAFGAGFTPKFGDAFAANARKICNENFHLDPDLCSASKTQVNDVKDDVSVSEKDYIFAGSEKDFGFDADKNVETNILITRGLGTYGEDGKKFTISLPARRGKTRIRIVASSTLNTDMYVVRFESCMGRKLVCAAGTHTDALMINGQIPASLEVPSSLSTLTLQIFNRDGDNSTTEWFGEKDEGSIGAAIGHWLCLSLENVS